MKQFSIIDTLRLGLNDYQKHWGLLVLAAALSSGIWLIRPIINPVQVSQAALTQQDLSQASSTPKDFMQKLEKAAFKMQNTTRKKTPLSRSIDLVFYMISLFLQLGFIKICLELVDSGKSSLKVLTSQGKHFITAFGATALAMIVVIAVIVALLLFGGVLLTLFSPFIRAVIAFSSMLALVVLLLLVTPFIFFQWCIVDTQTSVIESFACSWRAVKPQLYKMILFAFLLFLIGSVIQQTLGGVVTVLLKMVLPFSIIINFAPATFCVSSLVTLPITYILLAHAYRKLA